MVSPPKLEMLVTVTFDVHLWYGPFHESWLSKSQIGSSFVYKHPNFHKKKPPKLTNIFQGYKRNR